MPVFKYAIKRIITAPSTYIISSIFLILPFIIFAFLRPTFERFEALYIWKVLFGFIITTFFTSYFAGSLLAKNISEEIEDGTFLLIISKPVSRFRIWFEKNLAIFITTSIIYFLVMTVPLLTFLLPRNNQSTETSVIFFQTFWPEFWKHFAIGFLILTFTLTMFSLLSYYLNSRNVITWISLFVAAIIITNVLTQTYLGKGIYQVIVDYYIYIPIILITLVFWPINFWFFKNKDFAK